MSYISEASGWRERRRHRQQITMAVIVVLILVVGLAAYLMFAGRIPTPGTTPLPTCSPTATPTKAALAPSGVRVNVYNATSRAGLAGDTARDLKARDFVIGAVANDPRRSKVSGTAVVRYGPAGAAGAKLVGAQVKGAKLVKDKRKSRAVDLVLGNRFSALAQPTPTPTPSPTRSVRCVPPSPSPTSAPSTPSVLPKVTPTGKTPQGTSTKK